MGRSSAKRKEYIIMVIKADKFKYYSYSNFIMSFCFLIYSFSMLTKFSMNIL